MEPLGISTFDDGNRNDTLGIARQNLAERNFGLSEIEFQGLAIELRDGNQLLFERIFLKNFSQCRDYIVNKDKATQADAYDATMAALLQLRNLIVRDKVKYGNLRYLFCLMARQAYQRSKIVTGRIENLPALHDAAEEEEIAITEEDLSKLERAFTTLGQGCRELLTSVFHRGQSLKSFAELNDRTPQAVRQQKGRCLKKLRTLFTNTKLPC